MSPPRRLGPQLVLPTEVTRISTIEKSELFWTWSVASVPLLLLHPATASPPSAATTQAKYRRFCMAKHPSNGCAAGARCPARSCTRDRRRSVACARSTRGGSALRARAGGERGVRSLHARRRARALLKPAARALLKPGARSDTGGHGRGSPAG